MMRTDRAGLWGALVVPAALAVLVALSLAINPARLFPLDDAYITLENARILLGGSDPSYGTGAPMAATSVLHLALLAGLGRVLPLVVANHALMVAAAALYAAGLFRLLRAVGGDRLVATTGTLAGLTAGAAWFQLMNGLETGLAMAAVSWVAVLLVTRRFVPLALMAGFLPMLRPELALLSLTLGLAAVWEFRVAPRRLVPLAGLAAVGLAGAAGLALLITGSLWPATAGAKTAFFAEAGQPLFVKYGIVALVLLTGALTPILLGLVVLHRVPRGWALGLFALLFLAAAGWSLPGGLVHNDSRYLYILLPLGMAGLAAVAAGHRLLRAGFVVLAGGYLLAFPVHGWPTYRAGLAVTAGQEALAAWARKSLPADARILIHDAGYIAWRTDFALVDLVGLKTPSSVPVHRAITLPSNGRSRGQAVARIAASAEVSHAIIHDDPFWGIAADGLRDAGWRLDPLRPDAPGGYRIYALTPPDPAEGDSTP